MPRFSHFLIPDSGSETSVKAVLPAGESADAVDGSLHESATRGSAGKDIIHFLPRNAENAPPAAEKPVVPSLQLSTTRGISLISLPHASAPSSPGASRLAEAAGHQASLLPSSPHVADVSEAARPAISSQQSEDGANAQSVLSASEQTVLIDSADADAAPLHVEAASSRSLDLHKDRITSPAAGASGLPLAASSGKGILSVSPGARAAAVQEEGHTHLIKETRSLPRTTIRPVATADSASHHRKGSVEEGNKNVSVTPSSPTVVAAAGNAAGGASPTSDTRLVTTSAPCSTPAVDQQRNVAGAEAHPSDTLSRTAAPPSHAGEAAAPPKQKKSFACCRLFSLCKRKKKASAAASGRDSAARLVQSTAIQTEVQPSPAGFSAAAATESLSAQSLSIPVAPDAAAPKPSLVQLREANSAESKGEEGAGKEAALPPSAHESPAQTPAGLSVPDAAASSAEAHNELLRSADANVEEDRRDSAHGTPPASSDLEGPDAALKKPGDPAMATAGSGKAREPDTKERDRKRVKVLVRRRRPESEDSRGSQAGSADAQEASDSGEDARRSAHSGEAKVSKASTTPSVRDSLGERETRPSAVAVSGPLVKVRQPLPHSRVAAVASRSSASHSSPHNGSKSFSGSGSYSYSYSSSYGASKSPAASSAASANVDAAQKSVASNTPRRRSAQESSTLSGMRSARNASSASKQSRKPTGMFEEEEEPLLCMPAYWRRILLDLRARERRDAEEAAREWRELTFRPQIHSNPYCSYAGVEPAVMADRSHTPLSGARESPAYSPASGFSEPSLTRYQVRRVSPRLLGPRCAPKQPAPPPFKPFISPYAKSIARPRHSVFNRLYKPRSLSPPALGEAYTHRPQITKLAYQLYPSRRSEDGDTIPCRRSVFDRLYHLRRSPDSSPTTPPYRRAANRPPFQPQITDMAHRQSAVLPRESFGDRLYRNGRSLRGENHAPFHTHEGFRDDSGTEHTISESEGSDSLSWSSQSSFAVRGPSTVSLDLDRRFSQTHAAVEAV
ncbi:hypothetical protein LSCM4_03692 [Leishmania orientalis]|uniref:Uncharacterized protein n=1 Tax=Leishmania orientalis TaxID=2249476 RepID=A0A836G253_9TRYP|nr:hypothetical protein LSCM4_03692 [Leishmania orientalis]